MMSAKLVARIVNRSICFDHMTPVLADLHWLPVKYRIQLKIAVVTFKVLTTQEPSYLTDSVRLHVPTRNLRSSGRNLLQDNRTKLAFTERAFCHAAPAVQQYGTIYRNTSRLIRRV